MSNTSYSIEKDLKEAAKMADSLGEYVRGKQLYSTIAGGFFGGGIIHNHFI